MSQKVQNAISKKIDVVFEHSAAWGMCCSAEGSAHDLPLTQSFTCERGRRLASQATQTYKLSNNKP